jgi:hypothetical protein
MSILIQIKPSIEDRLRETALKKGLKLDQFISQFLENTFSDAPPLRPSVSAREAALLQQINLGIAPETWQLYEVLKKKFQNGKITEKELAQFQDITEQVEIANVNRIEVLAELAQIRNVSLRVVMAQLGISKHE